MTDNSWVTFFTGHAAIYDENIFTKNTLAEVDFLIDELQLQPGMRVLDIGCGTGRHSIELAKRGFRMTGLDITPAMLAKAREKAQAAGVEVEWVQGDATKFSFPEPFDAVICLCEGSFGLLGIGDDPIEHPLAVLRNAQQSLKSGGNTLFTVLSAFRIIRKQTPADVEQGRFDPLALAEVSEAAPWDGAGPIPARERGFVPTELRLLFQLAGFTVRHIWGGTAGTWGHRAIDLDEYEIMVVAEKAPEA